MYTNTQQKFTVRIAFLNILLVLNAFPWGKRLPFLFLKTHMFVVLHVSEKNSYQIFKPTKLSENTNLQEDIE